VISRLGGYADGLILVVPYVRWQTRRGTRRNVDILSSMPRYIYLSSKSLCKPRDPAWYLRLTLWRWSFFKFLHTLYL
jgi:hypothetical protein